MGRTPDAADGPRYEEELRMEDRGAEYSPGAVGYMAYANGSFAMRDASGVFDPRSGSGGITESQHESLDTLVHDIAEDSYIEITRSSGKVTDVVIWTDSGKTKKIREWNITRSSGKVSQVVAKQYDGNGDLITGQTLTSSITRTGGQVSSITSVES